MKRFSGIITKIASLAMTALLALGTAGCSVLGTDESENQVTNYGRVALNLSQSSSSKTYSFSNISLKYKKDGGSNVSAGTWSDSSALESGTISIPVGTYTFTLGATITITADGESDTDTYTGTAEGTVKADETTVLTFNLKRASSSDSDDEETVTKGTLNDDGTYTIIDWIAADYEFTTETSSTDISGTYGDVTVSKGKAKAGNSYIQLSKSAGALKVVVPSNTSKIIVNVKCGSSSASSCKMTVADSNSSWSETVDVATSYTDYTFEPTFTALKDDDGNELNYVTLLIQNTDSSSSLNINSVTVIAPTAWTASKSSSSTSTKTDSANSGTYEETGDVTVDMTITTEATSSGSSISIKKAEGWLNSAYVIFEDNASSYTITCDGTEVDDELLRHYTTYKYNENSYSDGQTTWNEKSYSNVCRVDVLGLSAGEHTISITPDGGSATTVTATVLNHDRSGYAFSGSDTPGAYNKDGTLKSNAKVIYVTKDTAKTVSLDITNSKGVTTTYTGLQNILRNSVLKTSASDLSLDIRVIGKLSIDDLDAYDSSAEGLCIKNNVNASKNPVPVTIEGVGHDATIWGFGLFARDSSHVEISNLGIMCFLDDGISLDTDNDYTWVHNVDIFYGSTGGDSDQAKGDGSLDVKGKSNWQSYSYMHFWDSGKSSLCGMKSETSDSRLTYHHNWFDHSDSRHPRIRTQTVHIYNNYFDGNAKYGVGVTMGASAFVEQNVFRNPHDPMMSSGQGTDAMGDGTFSGETGGIIKAYNNMFFQLGYNNVKFQYITNLDYPDDNDIDAYVVTNRSDTVPSSVTAVSGGSTYNNFDTSEDLHLADGSLTEPKDALSNVVKFAGRHNPDFAWTFDNAEQDSNYSLIKELKAAVVAYDNTGLSKIGQ